ncbi:glucan biosynthesis protein [Neptunicoccus cionae]|uniref:Glucans biosynthesis protein G n=1 Tax=Neptunicoccus cionae TaxID=2035344 RepID=A0A916R4V8_9RHOB|nr:glucan biosynthesis protein G [Amylibacter cionae]GGA31127.1 glucans biosynthesis protein G [Amylibacter cionae]
MLRREFIAGLAALAASPVLAQDAPPKGLQLGAGVAFKADNVIDLARNLSKQAYKAPASVPEEWTQISYEDYQSIWFDNRNALWNNQEDVPLRLDVFAPGLYFPHPVEISIVENGVAAPLLFDMEMFGTTDKFPELPVGDSLGYSGLRLRAELQRAGIYEEFAVFQGASYFRAIGNGNIYGLSARALAIDTAQERGEEFPVFRAFWLEKPNAKGKAFVVHALLDSPSCTGAYRFEITPGEALVMDIEARLFPREDMEHLGVAPLTSMFQYDQTNRHKFTDFRPAVHDSDGLLIVNGAGETLWRPLANPAHLQISSFIDNNPTGFGLMQRAQEYRDFADLEALYHRRPGVWVEPKGDWGAGAVTLVEIPTPSEVFDNIVCFWTPKEIWRAGSDHALSYRLTWSQDNMYGNGLAVRNTMIGSAFENRGIIVVIDFDAGAKMPTDFSAISHPIQASAGKVSSGVLQRNPETGGPRLAFKFEPDGAKTIEFRTQLLVDDTPLSEIWLYRWTV